MSQSPTKEQVLELLGSMKFGNEGPVSDKTVRSWVRSLNRRHLSIDDVSKLTWDHGVSSDRFQDALDRINVVETTALMITTWIAMLSAFAIGIIFWSRP